jgi:protein-L-isoaspartate(D-aspartate) O-methyltransferase
MMQPKVEARILQELAIQPHETVYEVGTGLGLLHRARREPRAPTRPPDAEITRT